jgi:hypothetical protein
MEMYCFAEKPIEKLLKVTLRASDDVQGREILSQICDALVAIFMVRCALSGLARPIGLMEAIEKRCHLEGQQLIADPVLLIEDAVNHAGGQGRLGVNLPDILDDYSALLEGAPEDARFAIRGHDFCRILCFHLKSVFPQLFRDDRAAFKAPSVFANIMITCLEIEELSTEKLFVELIDRYSAGQPEA